VMLGLPMSMLIPRVVGVELTGELAQGATATDLVLTVTEMLRRHGVVGKFVEFFGHGLARLPIADRATIGNMSPEYGSTCAIFPIDAETLRYLKFTGRPPEQIALVEAYARKQHLWHDENSEAPTFSERLELDLSSVVPSIAGPRRPQDRVALTGAQEAFRSALAELLADADDGTQVEIGASSGGSFPASDPPSMMEPNGDDERDSEAQSPPPPTRYAPRGRTRTGVPTHLADGHDVQLHHGDVVIAAITSCTNTSNPSVMLAAGLLARNAVARGLHSKPWVKTSLAPGSKVVTDYYARAGLTEPLEALGFHLVGYGCTTCIGNSGPLPAEVSAAVNEGDLAVVSVLSGNRNFEGRINPDVKMNYLASPPLVIAYALAGTMDIDLRRDPLGEDQDGSPVYLHNIWPTSQEIAETIEQAIQSDMFRKTYDKVFAGDEHWSGLDVPTGQRFTWEEHSTYVRQPPYFDGMPREPQPISDIEGARVLAVLGDSVTTDHISPAGSIKRDGPAGAYLKAHGVAPKDFNSYGSRRGNHEVMVRGTFANIRLRNLLAPGTEGGVTLHLPDGEQLSIYDAAMRYEQDGVPLVVLAGKEYGSGSSRDWAAKGTSLLGVRAVIAESFERIHRSNLVGMGVLPLQFSEGESVQSLELTGRETFAIAGLSDGDGVPRELTVNADGREFQVAVRIDTPTEQRYYRHGGILQFALRELVGNV
jgi:aconitate hydratase